MSDKLKLPKLTKAQRDLDAYVDVWLEMKAQGATIGLWENMDLVSDFMAEMGRKGGKVRNAKKGFGSMTPGSGVKRAFVRIAGDGEHRSWPRFDEPSSR